MRQKYGMQNMSISALYSKNLSKIRDIDEIST